MIINFDKDELIKAVNTVIRAVSGKTQMSILECILIRTVDGKIVFTANDSETAIETVISEGCEILEEGSTAVDARLFSDIVRKIDGALVHMEKSDSVITISSLNSEFKIQERDPDEFPLPSVSSDGNKVSLSQLTLKRLIQGVIFSLASNDSNKMMTGGYMEIAGGRMKITTLDGHRISVMSTALIGDYPDKSAIIPGKALSEIARLMEEDAEKEVEIVFDKDFVVFGFNDTTVSCRLIDGQYFDIKSMISSDYDLKVSVERKDFISRLDAALVLVSESDKKPLILNISDDAMTLRMNSSRGSHNSTLAVKKTGDDIVIGFNPKFLIDPLRAISEDTVDIYFTTPKAPCYIRDEEGEYVYVVLPIYFNPAYY